MAELNAVLVGPDGDRELIFIETEKLREQLKSLHPKMLVLLLEAVRFAKKCGWTPCLTSIYRTQQENRNAGAETEIHCTIPHRAVDLRTKNVNPTYVSDLDKHLDTNWIYDPMRPKLTCSYEKLHGTGPHLHLQVCDATVRRTK